MLPNGSFRQYDVVFMECSENGAGLPVTWRWSFGDGTNATVTVNSESVTENHTYENVGVYNVTCRGTDSLGAQGSANITIRVASWPLVITDLHVEPQPSVLQGYVATLEAVTSWGYGPENITWSGLPPGCTPPAPPESAFLIVCTPTAGGTYNVSVAVWDPVTHHTARSYATLVVTPAVLGMPEGPGIEAVALVVLLAIVTEVLVRLTRVLPKPSDRRRYVVGWILAAAGGLLGLASFLIPWLYIPWGGSLGGPVYATFRPADILANAPATGVLPAMESSRPSYPNFLWFVIAPQIVGYLIFAAGAIMALLRRMQGGFVMLLGLVVAALAIPYDSGWFWGLDAGWYLGLIAAFVAAAGFYTWRPPADPWPSITPVPRIPAPQEPKEEGPPSSSAPGSPPPDEPARP